jgi:hypothetical protein
MTGWPRRVGCPPGPQDLQRLRDVAHERARSRSSGGPWVSLRNPPTVS